MTDRFFVAFEDMKCIEETDDGSSPSDEPYALLFAADLQGPIPRAEMFRTHVFGGTQQTMTRKQHVRFWGLDGKAQPIANPDQVIFLVALMENDDSNPNDIVSVARPAMFGNLTTAVTAGRSRSQIVTELIATFRSSANIGATPGIPNPDDQVGSAQELRITHADLSAAKQGMHAKQLVFKYKNGDAGKYRLDFGIVAAKAT